MPLILLSLLLTTSTSLPLYHSERQKASLLEKRIRFRQEQIKQQLLLPKTKMMVQVPSNNVWVDSNTLGRFFSCDDGLVDLFQKASESSIIDNTPFLCEHKSGEITVISRELLRSAI